MDKVQEKSDLEDQERMDTVLEAFPIEELQDAINYEIARREREGIPVGNVLPNYRR